ncbi:hypothetical protein [Flavobacterium sp.]|uniref:hypothetical protein n=1 Tax=Flavobacterium sp. TaxID=239 RepID=UPI003F6A2BA1
MRKIILLTAIISLQFGFSQEHFSGINTARRVGILNANFNPAELSNLSNSFEINIFTTSLNISNNKISFQDIVNSNDIEDLIFNGNEPVNMRLDLLVNGPGFAFTSNKWAFGVYSNAVAKANIIDVDVNLGDALVNSNALLSSTSIGSKFNQKINAASWGELGFTIARNLFEDEKYKFNLGTNIRLLFPSSYANLGADKFFGTIQNVGTQVNLINASANVNIAYSGPIANGFTDANNFNEFFSTGINGYAADFGLNFKIKDTDKKNDYVFNSGIAIRNIGSMTFKAANNVSTDYNLSIQGSQALDLNQFQDIDDLQQIENILIAENAAGNIDFIKNNESKDFKINLPTLFSAYADLRLGGKFRISAYTQQKISEDSDNDYTTTQNSITITPRFSSEDYEFYVPLSNNEISGFTGGFGVRLGGFFIGSGSILTAALDDTKQADLYLGFRIGF